MTIHPTPDQPHTPRGDDMTATHSGDFSIGSRCWPGAAKVVEEAAEVTQVIGKLIASAGSPDHWDGTDLRPRIEEEVADLRAALAFFIQANDLDADAISRRAEAKRALFQGWHLGGAA